MKNVEILNFRKNIMGTLSFDLKAPNMRKKQDFIVYPINEKTDKILIQSDTRIAQIYLDGTIILSKSYTGGAYFHHLNFQVDKFNLSSEQMDLLKAEIKKTSGVNVGQSIVKCDNSFVDKF